MTEEEKGQLEHVSFMIISYCGEARSKGMEALEKFKSKNKNNDAECKKILQEAEELMINAEKQHMDLIVDEANGIYHTPTILFLHAEDQLLSTQTLLVVIKELIVLHDRIDKVK